MPKTFILMACEECNLCIPYSDRTGYCVDTEKRIPDIGKIAEFCELDDWEGDK